MARILNGSHSSTCTPRGRKGRDGQKNKIGKANERKEKVKRGKDEVNGQGGRGVPQPHMGRLEQS